MGPVLCDRPHSDPRPASPPRPDSLSLCWPWPDNMAIAASCLPVRRVLPPSPLTSPSGRARQADTRGTTPPPWPESTPWRPLILSSQRQQVLPHLLLVLLAFTRPLTSLSASSSSCLPASRVIPDMTVGGIRDWPEAPTQEARGVRWVEPSWQRGRRTVGAACSWWR